MVAGAGLFAIELGPVLGLTALMGFELKTTQMAARAVIEEQVPGKDEQAKRRRRALARRAFRESIRDRVGVAVGLVAVVIYANTAGLEWVKGIMFMTVGAVLLSLAWLNLGKGNSLMRILMRSFRKNLEARGISIDTDDQEGPTVVVDAELHAVVRPIQNAESSEDPNGLPATGQPPRNARTRTPSDHTPADHPPEDGTPADKPITDD
ncbi:MAG: hypothetical protein AAGI91_17480 [Bacteroidota bacterium]